MRPDTLQRCSQRLHVLWHDPSRGSKSHQAICRCHICELYAIWSQHAFLSPGECGALPRHLSVRSRTKLITVHPYLFSCVLYYTLLMCMCPHTHAVPLKVPDLLLKPDESREVLASRGTLAHSRPCCVGSIHGAASAPGRAACAPSAAPATATPCAAAGASPAGQHEYFELDVVVALPRAAVGHL